MKMVIIVPTRGRPQNVAPVIEAWQETGAPDDGAELCFACDADDPAWPQYQEAIAAAPHWVRRAQLSTWKPMVYKLDTVARWMAMAAAPPFALGFAGDDHRPRTRGWAGRYLNSMAEMGTGIVSCPDGYRPDDLPTQWAMTSDIVRALGRMVPAPVEHLYCDDAIRDLAKEAGCWRYLDDVLIEHLHPLADKGSWDAQYKRVNSRPQFERDSASYLKWRKAEAGTGGLFDQATAVHALMAR